MKIYRSGFKRNTRKLKADSEDYTTQGQLETLTPDGVSEVKIDLAGIDGRYEIVLSPEDIKRIAVWHAMMVDASIHRPKRKRKTSKPKTSPRRRTRAK